MLFYSKKGFMNKIKLKINNYLLKYIKKGSDI